LLQASSSPLRVGVEHLRNLEYDRRADELKATNMEVVSTLKDLLTMHPLYNEQLRSFANVGGDFNNPDRLADMAASLTSADEDALQALLEELDIPKRCCSTRNHTHRLPPPPPPPGGFVPTWQGIRTRAGKQQFAGTFG